MNRLFWKIFFGFWLTTIAVVIVTAVVTMQVRESLRDDPVSRHFERTQSAYARAAAAILDSGGIAELGVWLRELRGPGGARGRLQVLDERGEPLFGPPPAADITAGLLGRDGAIATPRLPPRVFTEPLYGPDGTRYWFVSDMRRSRPFGPPRVTRPVKHNPVFGWTRLAVALVVSGLVCYGLARYLTQPIRRLQAASTEIANGNFAVRIEDPRRRDELGDLGRDFDRMAAQLERLHASQQQLLRDVSHELRSPLARLQVALGLARQRGATGIASELDRIEQEAEVLESLIARLLTIARLESGVDETSDAMLDVDALVADVARDARFEGSDDDKTVVVDGSSGASIRGDRAMIRSALENIVRNALRYTDDHTAVEVTIRGGADAVEIAVRDHGPGVDPSVIDGLFKPFVRADYARDRDSGGYGIGLAIAESAVKRHGGTIRARNHADGGLCVTVSLPSA